MADSKLSALTEISIPDLADDLYTVDDTGPTSYKVGTDRLLGLLPGVCDGRLTLTSGVPVTVDGVSGASTVYFTPYVGDKVSLYDGTRWRLYSFSELSFTLSGLTSGLPYDLFLYDNAGTLTLEATAWTSGTLRATALVRQNGVLCKTGALTRRYLGTFYTSGTTTTEDTSSQRFLWNMYHRKQRSMQVVEATVSWTYTTATIRQANGSTANQLAFVRGLDEDAVTAVVSARFSNTNAGIPTMVGVGLDTTTAFTGMWPREQSSPTGGLTTVHTAAFSQVSLGIGYHFLSWNEFSGATGTTTWYGTGVSSAGVSGIIGTVWA